MKKIIAAMMIVVTLCMMLTGCNQTLVDTVYRFDRALIEVTDGEVIEVEIDSWKDWDGESQIQITAKDGSVYLTDYSKCILIRDGK